MYCCVISLFAVLVTYKKNCENATVGSTTYYIKIKQFHVKC